MRLVESFLEQLLKCSKVPWASSYGHFIAIAVVEAKISLCSDDRLLSLLLRRGQNYNNTNSNGGWHGGVGKTRFQQSATTHSGTGEKETLNINVVGTKTKKDVFYQQLIVFEGFKLDSKCGFGNGDSFALRFPWTSRHPGIDERKGKWLTENGSAGYSFPNIRHARRCGHNGWRQTV